ncbi:hypothetical protein DPMN_020284 [Dreissena polymorpha]|uniref:Uncharacterized protein n=1 Tax=Dreissena polymorpha TaxID=45954 RepID=A0A9D4NKU6_DREPO|nr:hypothetical protein DPMN_020284 [Dreissena polymorpha]
MPSSVILHQSKTKATKLSRHETHSETCELAPMPSSCYTDTDNKSHRMDTHRGVKLNKLVVSANLATVRNSENISTCVNKDTVSYHDIVSCLNTPDVTEVNAHQLQSVSKGGRRNNDPATKCINKDTDLIIQQDDHLRVANNCDGNALTKKQYLTKTKPVLVESEGIPQIRTVVKPPTRSDQNVNESVTGVFKTVHNQEDDNSESDADEVYVTKSGAIKALRERRSKNK